MRIEIYENNNFNNIEELFRETNKKLLKNGLVKETFLEALKNREKQYPTGLRGIKRNIAIPHADPEHVNESAYIVVMNKKPITFKEMGNESSVIDVNLIVFILSSSSSGHMELLKNTLSLTSLEKELTSEEIKSVLEQK